LLRVALRARARQLGDELEKSANPGEVGVACPLLVSEVAYEQWHRFLFARFLEANHLLHHPQYGVPVSLADCDELAADLGEPDGWSVAARFAAEVLPAIFKPSDPSVRIGFAREDLIALESVVTGIPVEVFSAEDSLGWVYQYWQSKAKDSVNASGRKVGGADLSPVTQLFTENYMVRFLLENSLGAWWAGRHPDSRLVEAYTFLRRNDEGSADVGAFDGWPATVAEVTVMDPCCGSGHFLVAAFGMLWRMRAEEEGLSPVDAQDAVLTDNLFGLELDARCTQIAMFAITLEAWKQGGFRDLPVPHVACSGIPAKASASDWTRLAEGDSMLESALVRLHALFADADTLGSLIDPVRAAEDAGLESVDWRDVAPLVQQALISAKDTLPDPASAVFGDAATAMARSADYLSRKYWVIVTNVPYLTRTRHTAALTAFADAHHPTAKADLATLCLDRFRSAVQPGGVIAAVTPQYWLYLKSYWRFREEVLRDWSWRLLARLGTGAFGQVSGEVVNVCLGLWEGRVPAYGHSFGILNAEEGNSNHKSELLPLVTRISVEQSDIRNVPEMRITAEPNTSGPRLERFADSYQGISSGDYPRWGRKFWELAEIGEGWIRQQSSVSNSEPHGGREHVFRWDHGRGPFVASVEERLGKAGIGAWIRGLDAWGKRGVCVTQMSGLSATIYEGDAFDSNVAVIIPKVESLLAPIWEFARSGALQAEVRKLNTKVSISNKILLDLPFDADRWSAEAEEAGPLPEPWSDDATQWPFSGRPHKSRQPLQVAVARLLGFRWPDQGADLVDQLADTDGIACLPAVAGEQAAAERVRAVLAASFGAELSTARLDAMLEDGGGRAGDLAGWLANGFFKCHCNIFGNRPFVWHVWDGLRDGFSALVNYHRLDRATLEKLTYRTLGWWIDRQRADADSGVLGADTRLGAAQALQAKLQLILEGEPPYDIYVRWKTLSDQPIGWDPDLDDGVRANIRPFVEAGVLRSKFTIHWKKDRGANSDGSDRHNDLHYSVAEKRKARGLA
jgi:hypothetical protein